MGITSKNILKLQEQAKKGGHKPRDVTTEIYEERKKGETEKFGFFFPPVTEGTNGMLRRTRGQPWLPSLTPACLTRVADCQIGHTY